MGELVCLSRDVPIISSIISDVGIQHDGRRWVLEKHVDHLGIEHVRHWLAMVGENLNTALVAYASRLLTELRDVEISRNIALILIDGRLAATSTDYSTGAENFVVLRSGYQSATRAEAIFAGDFLASLTDAQLRNLFGMTQAEVTTLRTNKLTPATNAAATIRATAGA